MTQLNVLDHPVLRHKLGHMRDKSTNSAEFRRLVAEISVLLAYEATKDLNAVKISVDSPIGPAEVDRIKTWPALVAIMRAGNGMIAPVNDLFPNAKVGHIGIYRDRFVSSTIEYYLKMPEGIKDRTVLVLDLLIATADTAIASINRLKQFGAKDIRMISILVSKKGFDALIAEHPDIRVYCVGFGDDLTDTGFLDPGIGDVGSRFFNTE